jgi:hypothetical protein
MRKLLLAATLLIAPSVSAFGDTWIARCNGMQFNFDKTSKTFLLYFNVPDVGIVQMATGRIIFDNGVAVRGPITGNPLGFNGQTLTEIGINNSRKNVYVQYRHPSTGALKSGAFCSSAVQIVP